VPELAKGDGLRTRWRRPTRVRIPAPASKKYLIYDLSFTCRGGVGGYPLGLWIPRLGFESRPWPQFNLIISIYPLTFDNNVYLKYLMSWNVIMQLLINIKSIDIMNDYLNKIQFCSEFYDKDGKNL
jgi:hypothetical protein